MSEKSPRRILHGIAVSPGIGCGPIYIHDRKKPPVRRYTIPGDKVEEEVKRFETALEKTREQLREMRRMVTEKIDKTHGGIFEAQEVLLDDPLLAEECRKQIREKRLNAEYVLENNVDRIRELFGQIEIPQFSLQNLDVLDVANRLQENLMPESRSGIDVNVRNAILVAHDLHPSDTARLNRRHVLGIATEAGGPTSHFAILAKALSIPAVTGIEGLMSHVGREDEVIIDGYEGKVTVNPSRADLEKLEQRRQDIKLREESLQKIRDLPCETLDGYSIELAANLELPVEIEAIQQSGAQGIGLFRSEFFYINRGYIPPEEEQYHVYREIVERMAPLPVICRTLDLGGDKFISHPEVTDGGDLNPYLGLRAIRLCLANPDMFRSQIRAVLRASAHGRAKIMFPFITDISEVRRAKDLLEETKRELFAEEIPFDQDIEVGIMIETPSAALTAEQLAEEVDFFSLGTNDLIQYTMAVDRANESVAELYNPLHPAVLELIERTIDAAHKAGIWVGVCGEMAGDPAMAVLLMALGIDELSMSSVVIPTVKRLIRSITLEEAQNFRAEILESLRTERTRTVLNRFRKKYIKDGEPEADE